MLENHGEPYEVIEYLKTPLSKEELSIIAKTLGLRPLEFIRKSEKIYKEKYAQKELTDEEWLTVLSTNPILIERPIVVKGNKAVIGRPSENIKKLL